MAIPLVSGDVAHGVVSLSDRADGQPFDRSDLRTARVLAASAALAVSGAAMAARAEEYRRITSIDPLTGLGNRRALATRMDEELERARRYAQDVTLLMMDLDGFKGINDSLGHVVGDAALRYVAQVLQQSVRKFDVCARYGGDEFAVLLPGSDAARAIQTAERIRRRVDVHPGMRRAAAGLHLTVSIGVATGGRGVGSAELLMEADRALYEAKGAGGNCIRLAAAEAAC